MHEAASALPLGDDTYEITGVTPDRLRAALAMTSIIEDMSEEMDIPPATLRQTLDRLIQTALVQGRSAEKVRGSLRELLTMTTEVMDPVPHATIEQERRVAEARNHLLASGAFSVAALAEGRDSSPEAIRMWLSRRRRENRLFTVQHKGEILVPAFVLGAELKPRLEIQPAVAALRDAGLDGWAMWVWFTTPSSWINGVRPMDLLDTNPDLLSEVARRQATNVA